MDNAIYMKYMFSNCELLSYLSDISKWNTYNVLDMSYMFSNCESLLSLPNISKWKTYNVNNTSYMFYNCKSLLSLPDISGWYFFRILDMSYMFSNCKSLSSLPDISQWNSSNMNNMFSNCISLCSLPKKPNWNSKNVFNMSYMFSNCESLSYIPDMSNCIYEGIFNTNYIFKNCFSILSLPKENTQINSTNKFQIEYDNNIVNDKWNEIKGVIYINPNEINKNIVLFNSENIFEIDVYLDNKKINPLKDIDNKIYYKFEKAGNYFLEIVFHTLVENFNSFFEECHNIISLDFTNLDSSNVLSMVCMFKACNKLKEIKGINQLITYNVTDMSGMFSLCKELEYLDLSGFDTSNVISMECMFFGCNILNEIKGINTFITDNVIDMNGMFMFCCELEYLDLSKFNTSNVINIVCSIIVVD